MRLYNYYYYYISTKTKETPSNMMYTEDDGEVYAEKQICVKQDERKIKSYLILMFPFFASHVLFCSSAKRSTGISPLIKRWYNMRRQFWVLLCAVPTPKLSTWSLILVYLFIFRIHTGLLNFLLLKSTFSCLLLSW